MTVTYHLRERVGRGGFGSVYRADRTERGSTRAVALKILEEGDARGEALRRLRDEAWLLSRLAHPGLVAAFELVELPPGPTLVLELVDGVDGHALLRRGPVPPGPALAIVAAVAGALAHAWEAEVDGRPLALVHRDVKPANVRVTPAGEVKLLDLGAATARFDARAAHTSHFLLGSEAYVAPERWRGVDDPRGDVFSLGLVLHELLAGRRHPVASFRGDGAAALGTRAVQVVEDAGVGASAGAVAALRDLIAAMLDAQPERRPTAREVAASAARLARAFPGPDLPAWAVDHAVPDLDTPDPDDRWRGRTFVVGAPRPMELLGWAALGAAGALLATVALGATVLVASGMADAEGGERTVAAAPPSPAVRPLLPGPRLPVVAPRAAPASPVPTVARTTVSSTPPRRAPRPAPRAMPPADPPGPIRVSSAPRPGLVSTVGLPGEARLVSGDRVVPLGPVPREVPPGTWRFEGTLEPDGEVLGVDAVVVEPGRPVVVRCRPRTHTCAVDAAPATRG